MYNEEARLAALRSYDILDTPVEEEFDDFTRLIAHICDAPIAVMNLVDGDRQWFKSEIGLGVRETPLDVSICRHAIRQKGLFVVPDTTRDPRFMGNPLVTGEPHLRFYAGALLESDDGLPLGTLCVLDYQPRTLSEAQADALASLARQVMTALELRRETRRLEQALQRNQRLRHEADVHRLHVQRILDGLHHPFISVDADLRVVYLNGDAARLFALPDADLSGCVLPDLLQGPAGEMLAQSFTNAMERDKVQVFRYRGMDAGRWIEVRVVPRPDGASVLAFDVTEQRQREERLHQVQRMRAMEQVAGGVAHEFNNVLAGLSGSVEWLQEMDKTASVADRSRTLTSMRSSIDRAAGLVSQLMSFTEAQPLAPEPLDPDEVLERLVTVFRHTLPDRIHLEFDATGGLPKIRVDRAHLRQAIVNLLLNARDAIPDVGRIHVRSAAELTGNGPRVFVCIEDNGVGMSSHDLALATEPFFTTRDVGEGVGLGLSMVDGFMRQSGGELRIVSEPGEGTTVTLGFPVIQGDGGS